MSNKNILAGLACCALISTGAFSDGYDDGGTFGEVRSACNDSHQQKIESAIEKARSETCATFNNKVNRPDYVPSVENHPLRWTSKVAEFFGECDLGVTLPGLDIMSIGASFDACSALQSVTSDVVADVNEQFQGVADEIQGHIDNPLGNGDISLSEDVNLNLNDALE